LFKFIIKVIWFLLNNLAIFVNWIYIKIVSLIELSKLYHIYIIIVVFDHIWYSLPIIKINIQVFMTNICSKLCVDNLIFLEGYINKCQNGMVFIQKLCKNYMQINFKNPRRIVTQYYSRKQARKLSTKRKWSCVNLSRLVGSEQYVVTKQFKKK